MSHSRNSSAHYQTPCVYDIQPAYFRKPRILKRFCSGWRRSNEGWRNIYRIWYKPYIIRYIIYHEELTQSSLLRIPVLFMVKSTGYINFMELTDPLNTIMLRFQADAAIMLDFKLRITIWSCVNFILLISYVKWLENWFLRHLASILW